ncbi:rna-directed dna polymerase : RNA-directed DNA polymerase OS=Methylobacterium radiotolerans (strain ATCC 27329 / DSM 1819 / JCM 2831) GN=Mrad2831_1389 PE=4 SV=1: RVT_1 [Gemmataceae bacterium]|nr:rna-directed dna polymerase : RNA-directed DNA polymerase OS=Methylobacterium radiotolerans (strain ATCC 27329 / DSM 1819 / JCM 2831) GN=Mrad2831_1389 PE=4 SV=1: RVT_1 [Gemmataceae bacterium]VTT98814.1 rna-directed dna polymerase : RNA-directed DNA polymerase OS=Methylobacterium radiotolerans (strain ATCC 27329 / DSM 1819 / JCM 2831) GN=Mrad2831_1389 PE=4 SV=1: RVT_1 [Gemmataceae bacterium]
MAFREDRFQRLFAPAHGELYRRKRVPKGKCCYRTLFVPCAPLARAQRLLLSRCLNQMLGHSHPGVYGGRPQTSVYGNAQRHLGQKFVVTLDLRDFFPSVTVNHVVATLLRLPPVSLVRHVWLDQPTQGGRARVPQMHRYAWTQRAAVLVARLTTFRGRLPQGAPTSPAISNLVFARYDDRIATALPGFVYTRYVDDLTLSVSETAARDLGIRTAKQAQAVVVERVERALRRSGFMLHPDKTRVTAIEREHRITGLRVGADRVDVPRRVKRKAASLARDLRKLGLVDTARRRIGAEIHAATQARPWV